MTQEPTPLCATEVPSVSREAFDIAVGSGDLQTIQAFFDQAHVRRDVEDTNTYIIETEATTNDSSARTFTLRDGSCPWFRRPKKSSIDTTDVPLLNAARNGHVHVLEWFFSRERAAFMRETLGLLLPLVASFDSRCDWYQKRWTSDPLVLETLFVSYIFRECFDAEKRQSILDQTIGLSQHFSVIDVAIAHGARVNEALHAIARNAEFEGEHCIPELQQAGALYVGADLLRPLSRYDQYQHTEEYLCSGVDWGAGPAELLINAAATANEDAVDALLAEGFVDVDARDGDGRTPLMLVSAVNPWTDLHPQFADPTPGIACALLDYCDLNLTENRGRTALHFAAECNENLARILLRSGADPNVRDYNGLSPFDYLDHGYVFSRSRWTELITLFLASGFDPFASPLTMGTSSADLTDINNTEDDQDEEENDEPRDDYRSLYDHLLEVEGGPEFIRQHPKLFERE